MHSDRSKTLDELEEEVWGEPKGEYVSSLVARCHHLRTKPIGEFSPGDLRVMIGQEIGLSFLVPLAIQVLESDPLKEESDGELPGSKSSRSFFLLRPLIGKLRDLGCQLATADIDQSAGDIAGKVGGEEADQLRHVFGLAPAP